MIFVNTLDDAARQALTEFARHAPGYVAQRAWMVCWSAEQVPVADIAARLHCRPKTVRKWLHRYQQEGVCGLQEQARSGRPSTLTAGAQQAIFTQVNQTPATFGYVFACWSVATLTVHLARRCWQRVSAWQVRQTLLKLGYRCRRPKLGPRLVDPQRDAIHQELGRRIATAAPDTVVVVEDETDLRLVPLLRRMWMRVGEQVILPAPVTNQCRTLFGTLNIHTGEVFYRAYARKRTAEVLLFLEALLAHYAEREILLIWDHATIHKSRALQVWLQAHPQLQLAYLPKYAAHRDNPIEKLWWRLKGFVTANRCCPSMDALLAVADKFFQQLTPDEVFQLVA
jgi:transposase